ncbi:hypothetical protein IM774_11705 [Erysipelotrichaceae bacterium RD49]|nr:hypothetical protein [Erysipelotrichaceae bacterium RD49]
MFSYLFQLVMVFAFGLYILMIGFETFVEMVNFSLMHAVVQIGFLEIAILIVTNLILFIAEDKLYSKSCNVEC